MFDKICIKDKELQDSKFDLAFLIDSMLYYGKVIALVHREELKILFQEFGGDTLKELINTGRLEIMFRNNMVGSMIFPEGRYGINTFTGKNITVDSVLYQINREEIRNSIQNQKFADEFSQLIKPYNYPENFDKIIIEEFENIELLKQKIPAYFNEIAPFYTLPTNIEIEVLKDGNFGPFDAYKINSNIDLTHFNEEFKKHNSAITYDVDFSGFFLAIAESKGDIYIASDLESEIVTSNLYSKFIQIEVEEIINKRVKSTNEIDLFDNYVLENCYSLGDAFVNGIISRKDLIIILEKSDKFRDWLENISEDKSLLGEYNKAILKKDFSDKLPTKTARFAILQGLGLVIDSFGAGGLGTIATTGLSAFDSFFLDKLINRKWKPNQFIDKTLKPKIKI